MTGRKWLKITLAAFAVFTLIGAYGVYRIIFPQLETIIILENRTEQPINVVSLTHDGNVLLKDTFLKSFELFLGLRPSQDKVNITLSLKHSDNDEMKTYIFSAEQGEYVLHCAFQIIILQDKATMSGCYLYDYY